MRSIGAVAAVVPDGRFDLVWEPLAQHVHIASGPTTIAQPALNVGLNPLDSIPALDSDPSAPVTIFLDFDGHFEPVVAGALVQDGGFSGCVFWTSVTATPRR